MSTGSVVPQDAALHNQQAAFYPFQVDRLLLLIGENPLPSYVAARTLLKAGGTPYLVYTSHTKEQADRVRDLLRARSPTLQPCQYIALGDYESDSYYIQKEIQEAIKPHIQEKWGLNYTGGTKPMAAHAYRALLKLQPHAVFSYLDPRRLEMCIDREEGERIRKKVELEILLTDLFELYSLKLQSSPTTQAILPDAAHAFAHQFHHDKLLADSWRNWCNGTLRKLAKKKNSDKWLSKTDLQRLELPLTYVLLEEQDLSDEISTGLQKHFNADVNCLSLQIARYKGLSDKIKAVLQKYFAASANTLSLQQAKEQGGFQEHEHLCKWLDGIWLEHYTLQQVQSIAAEYNIHDSALSFPIKNPQTGKDKFELDVAFMRGYQLFAISCTTDSSPGLCKSKLFEAYLRAKQLGGDEARVALVCCSDQPDALKRQLEVMLENPQIRVFGREHLSNLANEIAAWIEALDREAK